MRTAKLLLCTALATACGPSGAADDTEATLAIMQEVRPGAPLDDMLGMLDANLSRAITGALDGTALEDFTRAEAITDRLLEARVPFEWLTQEQYSLESRLRQVQSSADRVLAQIQTGVGADTVMKNLRDLRAEVVHLRETIAKGGTRAPPPIDMLLAGDTTDAVVPASADAPAPRDTTPRPLGTPVNSGY